MTKARLITVCGGGVTTSAGVRHVVEGGMYPLDQWPKADIIASVMFAEFPTAAASLSPPGDTAPGGHARSANAAAAFYRRKSRPEIRWRARDARCRRNHGRAGHALSSVSRESCGAKPAPRARPR